MPGVLVEVRQRLALATRTDVRGAAQHGAGADAAVRPQDHGHFESWFPLERLPGLLVRRSSAPNRWAHTPKRRQESDVRPEQRTAKPATGCILPTQNPVGRTRRSPTSD